HHYSRAVQLRTSLMNEIKAARKSGNVLPRKSRKRVWQEPAIHEEYIWLLKFISTGEKVTLIDIGGNSGYWAQDFIKYYPDTTVYAFEPVKAMYEMYVNRFSGNPKVKVFNTALGNTEETRPINVAKGYGLTSFNYYGKELAKLNDEFYLQEDVSIHQLNNYDAEINYQRTIIKVDVQGFESNVVRGGLNVFNKADLAIIECSFINEFKDQRPTFGELVALLREVDMHPVQFGVYDYSISSVA